MAELIQQALNENEIAAIVTAISPDRFSCSLSAMVRPSCIGGITLDRGLYPAPFLPKYQRGLVYVADSPR
jgi:hypothetical protein